MKIDSKFPIIICEGADCQGKSTLINQLMERHPNSCCIHNAAIDDAESLHKKTIDTALAASQEHWVLVDQLHLHEKVYGTVLHGKPAYDVDAFDRDLCAIPNLKKVLCVTDKETFLAECKDKSALNDMSKIWEMYNDIPKVDETWIVYNQKTDDIDLDTLKVTYNTKSVSFR